jgi:predicted exporter
MSIAREDIKHGWYWVLSRKNGELSIVRVETFDIEIDDPETVVMHHGWEFSDKVDTAVEKLDFIARVEPPSGLNYVSYKAAERRRESMFVFGCAGAMLVAVLFGAAAAGLFIAGLQWGLYLLAGIPLALAVGVGLMIPAISHDGAAHWLPRPLRDFTLAILNFVRGR